jgi:PAS domain S-box-containing protein
MMPDISHVRRNILILIGGAIAIALVILALISPAIIHLSPQATQEAQNSLFIFAPLLAILSLAIGYVYLQPISQVGRYLDQGRPPPSDLAQQARTRAFSAPFYFLFMLVSLGSLIPILINLYRLITRPGYISASRFSYALLIIVTSTAIALAISSLSRRILRPVLIVTADLAQDTGRRYEIRLRLAIVVLCLNFIVFYFLGVLSFNQVYLAAKENTADRFRQWRRDVVQAAPHLDDEALVALITGSDILTRYEATAALSDSNGQYLIAPPDSQQPPSTTHHLLDEAVERDGHFTLTFPIERDSGVWQLSVTYTFAPENTPIVHRTLLILLIFDAAVLGLTLVITHFLADDITRDLKYVTARLHDIARRGHVGEKVHTLSLDEVGDLIAAFDKVRETMTQQQDELNRRVDQMHQLHQASLALASNVNSEQMLDRICQAARDITASDSVTLLLYDPYDDSFVRVSQVGHEVSLDPVNHIRPEGMTRTVLNSRRPILIQDTLQDEPLHQQPERDQALSHSLVNPWIIEQGIRSVIAVPVISRAQVMGVLYVNNRQANAYDDEDVQLVSALASQAAAAIENSRLLDETMTNAQALEQRARNLWMINRISADLTSYLNPYEIFNATAIHLVELMEVDHCSISIFDKGAAEGVIVAEYPKIGTTGLRVPRTGNPAIEQVLTTKEPLAVPDILQDPLMAPVRKALAETGIRATLIAPLVARDEIIGIISLDSLRESHKFSSDDQKLCTTVAAQAATAASNARLLYDLQQQSRALSRKSQELGEESAKLDAVLTNMADGLVVTDLAGRIMVSNPAFEAIAGLPLSRSLRGRLLNETFSHATLRQIIADAMANPDQVAVADLELPDGRVLKASASALHMKEEADPLLAGQVMGVVTLLRDITHEVEVDRMKTEFISAVSHELRTPLTSILGFAKLIQREFRRRVAPFVADETKARRATDRILENLVIIETESQRLTQLINDVLDIAKMESGRIEWHMTDVDMADVIHSSINATAVLADERDLTLNVVIPSPLPLAWGDQDRLVQVMTNLLANAIKFTDEGEITVSSWAWRGEQPLPSAAHAPADLQPPALIVSVADTGIGIAQDDIPLVFERFRQVGDSLTEKPKGTGLGLSICKEILEHLGGAIWVESELGVGSTFHFALPLPSEQISDSADQRISGPAVTHLIERAAPKSGGERLDLAAVPTADSLTRRFTDSRLILVVDDEPHIRQLLHLELTDAGYQVIEAADGNGALTQARLTHPDLIILDVLMPGVSGFGVIGALRADPDTAHIPIIILSVAEEAERALELGAAVCLTKPVDVPHLLSIMERLLEQLKPVA